MKEVKEVIGTLILVDTEAIIRDYDLKTLQKNGANHDNPPIIVLNNITYPNNHVLMITQRKFAESGIGTPNLTLKAHPGDEIKWWEENIHKNTNIETHLTKIKPVLEDYMNWNAWFENMPELSDDCNNAPPYLSGKQQFWSANYSDHQFYTKIKDRYFAYNGTVKLRYQIDLQIMSKPMQNNRRIHFCTLRWFPMIHIQTHHQVPSDNPETFENQIMTRSINRDLLLVN